MEHRALLTSNLRPSTLKKLAWYLKVPSNIDIDEYFQNLPSRDEGSVLITFSKYTRALAGEDPELPPDDEAEERRLRTFTGAASSGSGATLAPGAAVVVDKSLSSLTAAASKAASGLSNANNQPAVGGPGAKKRKLLSAAPTTSISTPPAQFPIVEEGRKVAAKVDDEWIMMTVIKFNKRTKMYTLEDADEQAEETEPLEVQRDFVIPLASPEYSPPMFPAGSRVLAVFPGTTSFYPAVVVKTTRRALTSVKQGAGKPLYDYLLQFDDDEKDDNGETIPKKVKGDFVIEEVVV